MSEAESPHWGLSRKSASRLFSPPFRAKYVPQHSGEQYISFFYALQAKIIVPE